MQVQYTLDGLLAHRAQQRQSGNFVTLAQEDRRSKKTSMILEWSPRLQHHVALMSELEWAHWIIVESDWRCKFYECQLGYLQVFVDGKSVGSIPDMYLEMIDGSRVLREIKPKELAEDPENEKVRRQLAAQRAAAVMLGLRHEVWTEAEIFANAMLVGNWRRILPYLKGERSGRMAELMGDVHLYLKRVEAASLLEIESVFEKQRIDCRTAVLWLLHQGRLAADVDKRAFGLKTRFRLLTAEEQAATVVKEGVHG